MSWLLNLIADALSEFVNGLLDIVGDLIDSLFLFVLNANQTNFVSGLCTFSSVLGMVVLSFAATKRIFDVYIMQTEGDPDQNPIEIIYRLAMAVAIIGSNAWIYTELRNIALALVNDVGNVDVSISITNSLANAIQLVAGGLPGVIVAFVLFILVLIIALLIFAIITAIKASEITLMRILLPIFAVDLITSDRERWKTFFTAYVTAFCGYAVQIICFRNAATAIAGIGLDSMKYFALSLGWIVLAISTPTWLEKFVYRSGVGRTTGRVGGGMAQVASLLILRG